MKRVVVRQRVSLPQGYDPVFKVSPKEGEPLFSTGFPLFLRERRDHSAHKPLGYPKEKEGNSAHKPLGYPKVRYMTPWVYPKVRYMTPWVYLCVYTRLYASLCVYQAIRLPMRVPCWVASYVPCWVASLCTMLGYVHPLTCWAMYTLLIYTPPTPRVHPASLPPTTRPQHR